MSQPTGNARLATFHVDGILFGLEVTDVQEVTSQPHIYHVPLAPAFVRGLINLRGQIATALGLREIFGRQPRASAEPEMSVVCKIENNLVSMLVDSVGEVIEVENSNFEAPPDTIQPEVRKYVRGIYKINGNLLSVLDLTILAKELSPANSANAVASHA